jgi:hypothetical protein
MGTLKAVFFSWGRLAFGCSFCSRDKIIEICDFAYETLPDAYVITH